MTEEAAKAKADAMGLMMYFWGVLITLAQVLGLAFVLNHASASVAATCAKICAVIAVLIALPLMAYGAIYGTAYPVKLLGIDFAHILIGYTLIGIILSFFRGKEAIGE